MIKRILFVTLTTFVISLPVTGILSLSFDSDNRWQEPARDLQGQPAPKAAYLDGMNHYLRSLRFLIDDHQSFGPFT